MSGEGRGTRPLRGLLVAQFFGAFNDNAWRVIVTLLGIDLVVATAVDADAAAQARTTLATVALTLPLIVFSIPAGWLNDRVSKRSVIVWLKGVEVVLMAAAAWSLSRDPAGWWPLVILACMGAQSALFSPAKYGILPELVAHAHLSPANGLLEMFSTLAIIAGAGVAGVLLELAGSRAWLAALPLVVFAVVGLVAALGIPRVPAARAEGGLQRSLVGGWRAARADRVLWLAILGSVFFWLVASVLFQVVVVYVKTGLGVSNDGASLALGVLMVGLAAGSVTAGRLSGGRVEIGLIPLGALALAAFTVAFGALRPALPGTCLAFLAMGFAGGLINVPLNALKQWRSPHPLRGGVLALSNLLVYAAILAGSLGAGGLAAAGVSSPTIVLVTGAGVVAGTVWALWLMPDAFLRLLLVLATRTVYRLRFSGPGRVPERGGALLVANHVSFVDAFLLLAATDRPIRFLADEAYYEHRLLRPFMRALGAIPVSSSSGPKEMLRAMRAAAAAVAAGDLVCVFPEGQITRTGMLLPFRRGLERIVRGRDVPIVPIYLDRVWGSIFSRARGRFFTKVPARLPYPVTIAIGDPLPAATDVHELRRRVRELGTEAWIERRDDCLPLHHTCVRRLRRHPFRLAFADQARGPVRAVAALAGAVALARALRARWQGQDNVGVLLPASAAGALVNVAASLSGRTVVNLNFTAGAKAMASAVRQARLRTVVTSGVFLARAQVRIPEGVEPIWLEELAGSIGVGERLAALALGLLAPIRLLERACGAAARVRPEDLATIIFSSGSTGEPKGVPLTHFNIDSNLRGCIQVVPIRRGDRLLGILPFFHSFGYMATLWMAANVGVPVVFHPSPLDTTAVGALVRRYGVTMMFATPTFLQLYTRRIAPGQFGSLRLVIAGAEKLRPATAEAFRDHFGIEPLEGYGVTETSPVIAVNVPDFRARGLYQPGWRRGTVGQPIPGVSVRIVDPETHEMLPPGREGMILVRGPNVMARYLDRPDLTAAAFLDGWYVTGDIGSLDEDGFLTITDRYARFSKVGGEMVPHGAVEEALERCAGAEMDARCFAVTAVPDARKGERLVVLHTLEQEQLEEVFDCLRGCGLPNLFIPRREEFFRVEAIPLLGSGKVDLKAVRDLARALAGTGPRS